MTADLVIESLVAHRRCADCGSRYAPEDVLVISRRGQWIWELAVECRTCRTISLMQAVERRRGHAPAHGRASTTSELSADEYRHFVRLAPVRRADVIAVTAFLEAFDGDFARLFGRSPERA